MPWMQRDARISEPSMPNSMQCRYVFVCCHSLFHCFGEQGIQRIRILYAVLPISTLHCQLYIPSTSHQQCTAANSNVTSFHIYIHIYVCINHERWTRMVVKLAALPYIHSFRFFSSAATFLISGFHASFALQDSSSSSHSSHQPFRLACAHDARRFAVWWYRNFERQKIEYTLWTNVNDNYCVSV